MKTHLNVLTAALSAALFLTACSHTPTMTEADQATPTAAELMAQTANMKGHRHPAGLPRLATLPDQEKWTALYEFADNLDLTNPAIELKLHEGEGTSIYGVLWIKGKPYGAIIPENESASVTGETMAFTLSRALGVSDIYQPGVYHFLSGPNLTAFMKIVPRTPILDKHGVPFKNKNENRVNILKRAEDQPQGMAAVFNLCDQKPKDFDGISGSNGMISPTFTLSGSNSPVASFLKCDGPRPSSGTTVTFAGSTNNELEVAKELSAILLIDALEGEWDRFSGGNLQTMILDGHAKFVSIDNGGTWGGTPKGGISPTDRNLSMVTRFDRPVAEQILAMNDLFERGIPYLGLRNPAEFASAFDIAQSPKTLEKFKANLSKTAAHIRAHQGCYF